MLYESVLFCNNNIANKMKCPVSVHSVEQMFSDFQSDSTSGPDKVDAHKRECVGFCLPYTRGALLTYF